MSEVTKMLDRAAGRAADSVASMMTSTAKDIESGMASFFSGGESNARTHQQQPRELSTSQEAEKPTNVLGTVEAEHTVEGKRHYAVSFDNGEGGRSTTLVPAGKSQYNIGDDAIFKMGKDGAIGFANKGASYDFGL